MLVNTNLLHPTLKHNQQHQILENLYKTWSYNTSKFTIVGYAHQFCTVSIYLKVYDHLYYSLQTIRETHT